MVGFDAMKKMGLKGMMEGADRLNSTLSALDDNVRSIADVLNDNFKIIQANQMELMEEIKKLKKED